MNTEYDEILENDIFIFLDELRESGVVNMYGAVPYIVREFEIDKYTATEYLSRWMKTFSERHPKE